MKRTQWLLGVMLLATTLCCSLYQCQTTKNPVESYFLNLNDTVGYVGIDKCRTCHAGHYNTFIQTGMGSSFGPASRSRSKAIFNQAPVYDKNKDMYYVADWVDSQLRITEFRIKGKDTMHKRSEWVKYIVGSGHHTNSHMWEDNGYLFQAPLTWYSQAKRWDLPPGYETSNTGFGRKIDMECMSCHNAMPSVASESVNKFTKIPSGIDCERCHGPGELHVQLKSKGEIVDVSKEADRSIVNPSRLPWKLQVDLCQRCHLQGNNILKEGKTFADFRPGMHLTDVFDVYMPKSSSNEFFMAGHSERLQMSACFKATNTSDVEQYNPKLNFTCITCHDPHVSVKNTNTQKFNSTCINCHNKNGKSQLKLCSENAIKLKENNNNCVSCHMPSSNTQDIPHVSIHDHYIRKNYRNTLIKIQNSFELYTVNESKHIPANEIRAYITWFEKFDPKKGYIEQASKRISKNKVSNEIIIHFYYANNNWTGIKNLAEQSDFKTTDAWTYYRVAKAFDKLNSLNQAIDWYKKASEKMSRNMDFGVEYANALIRYKQYANAEVVLNQLLKEQPKHELALLNLGSALFNLGKIAQAKLRFQQALALNPDLLNAHLYLAHLYFSVGEFEKAKQSAETVLKLNPNNGDVEILLSKIKTKSLI